MPEDKKDFYDGTKIANPDTARDLANVEATQGQNARVVLEEALKKQHETGLTEKQRYNLQLMGELERKYPDAFFRFTDAKGRSGMVTRIGDRAWQEMVISQEGLATIIFHSDVTTTDIDWTSVLDFLSQEGNRNHLSLPMKTLLGKPELPTGYEGTAGVSVVDLSRAHPEDKDFYKKVFERSSEVRKLQQLRVERANDNNEFDENRLEEALSGL